MQKKYAGIWKIGPGIRNAIGRRRGGAGAVAAALAVCVIVASLAVSVVGKSHQENASNDDVFFQHPDNSQPVPWEKPSIEEQGVTYHGATPSRLPC